MLRAVIYARVSTEDQANSGSSLQMQKERCIAFVTAKGWNIVEVILDEGESAKNLLRPGMQRLLEMVKAKPREVDAVVVLKRAADRHRSPHRRSTSLTVV